MSFAASWLDLRAPADTAARDPVLAATAARYLGEETQPVVLDLGCGTGAACAAFPAPDLRWRLVDGDAGLLGIALERCGGRAEAKLADLVDLDGAAFDGVRLVTAFALLDLAGQKWIEALAQRISAAGAGLYATLCYDGEIVWDPPLSEDTAALSAFNAHQSRDKGLGPALGPAAAAATARALARRGYAVRLAWSPWRLGPPDAPLHAALVEGIMRAAEEMGLAEARSWAQARRAVSGWRCSVGHLDVLALPQGLSVQSNTTSESSP